MVLISALPSAPHPTPPLPPSPHRCGTLPFVFEPGFGFEQYVDYVLDVPMYFVYRSGVYHNVAGQSFRDFMRGALPGLAGASASDWWRGGGREGGVTWLACERGTELGRC